MIIITDEITSANDEETERHYAHISIIPLRPPISHQSFCYNCA